MSVEYRYSLDASVE